MTSRDEVLRKMISGVPPEGIEAEYIPDDYGAEPLLDQNPEPAFRYVNLGPNALRELRAQADQGEEGIDPVALVLAERFMAKRCNSAHQAGEPERGEPREAQRVDSLRDCVSDERDEWIIVDPSKLAEIAPRELGDLIDFDMLLGDECEI